MGHEKSKPDNDLKCDHCGVNLPPDSAFFVSDGERLFCTTPRREGETTCASHRMQNLKTLYNSTNAMLERAHKELTDLGVEWPSGGMSAPSRAIAEIRRLRAEMARADSVG